MEDAFKTWDSDHESLADIEARIHDGVPIDQLQARAKAYAERILKAAPWLKVSAATSVVEVGPGVGYIMQAFAERAGVKTVTGLDVAANMIGHARARVQRDGLSPDRLVFAHYDGVTFPWPDQAIDLFYSVAAIQHIPKPFAYNVLLEIHRCLKPGGTAVVHLLGWDFVTRMGFPFADEIRSQVRGTTTHWHHFYDEIELAAVVQHGLKCASHTLVQENGSIWLSWRK